MFLKNEIREKRKYDQVIRQGRKHRKWKLESFLFTLKSVQKEKKKGKKTKFQKITYAWGLIKGFTYHSHHLSGNSTSCSRAKKKNQNENRNSWYTSDKKWTRLFCLKFQLYKYPYVTCDFIEEYVNKIIRWWAFLHAYYDLFPNLDSGRFRFLTHDTGLLEKNHTRENFPRRRSLFAVVITCRQKWRFMAQTLSTSSNFHLLQSASELIAEVRQFWCFAHLAD